MISQNLLMHYLILRPIKKFKFDAKSLDSLRRAMISSAKIAGIKIIRLHDLRHSTASLLFANKVEANVAAKILGHSSIKTTLDIYTNFNNDKVKEAITKLDNLI